MSLHSVLTRLRCCASAPSTEEMYRPCCTKAFPGACSSCAAVGSSSNTPAARSEAERAGVEIRQFPLAPPILPPQSLCGDAPPRGTGQAQGRRGDHSPPDRFARPPHPRKGGPAGPPFRPSGFLLTGRGRFLLPPAKENGGGSPEGSPRFPFRPSGAKAVRIFTPARPPPPETPSTAARNRESASTHT